MFLIKNAHFFCEVGTNSNIYLREVLLDEIYFIYFEASSVEIIQTAGIGGEGEGQFVGIEGLIFAAAVLVQLAILSVAQQGMARVGELSTNLVGTAGDQLTLHKTQPIG